MIERAFIIAMLVLSIWYTMKPKEIFEQLGYALGEWLPEKIHPPVFECPVCMSPYYGTILYAILWGLDWWVIPTVIVAMGINAMINKLTPDKTCKR